MTNISSSISSVDQVITQLESSGSLLHDNWSVPRETGRFLHWLIQLKQCQQALEVGTSVGYSALWIAKALTKTDGHLDTIDAFASRQDQAKANIALAGLSERVNFHLGDALETMSHMVEQQRQFDFIFIDAAKREYLAYTQLAERLLVPGGLLVADNTQSHRKEMQDFLDHVNKNPEWEGAELETAGGQWVGWRR